MNNFSEQSSFAPLVASSYLSISAFETFFGSQDGQQSIDPEDDDMDDDMDDEMDPDGIEEIDRDDRDEMPDTRPPELGPQSSNDTQI